MEPDENFQPMPIPVTVPSDKMRDRLIEQTDIMSDDIDSSVLHEIIDYARFTLLEQSSDPGPIDPIVFNAIRHFCIDIGLHIMQEHQFMYLEENVCRFLELEDERFNPVIRKLAEHNGNSSAYLASLPEERRHAAAKELDAAIESHEMGLFFLILAQRFDIATNDAMHALDVIEQNEG